MKPTRHVERIIWWECDYATHRHTKKETAAACIARTQSKFANKDRLAQETHRFEIAQIGDDLSGLSNHLRNILKAEGYVTLQQVVSDFDSLGWTHFAKMPNLGRISLSEFLAAMKSVTSQAKKS